MSWETEQAEVGSGARCARCGIPLLVAEARHCGPRSAVPGTGGLTPNCGAQVARQQLARTGVQRYVRPPQGNDG